MSQQPYVTPADYPRQGDETDDWGSLQRTFNAAQTLKATAWLMGQYTIGRPLSIPGGVRVMGQGPAVTSIAVTSTFGATTADVMMVANGGVTVEGITLDATPAGGNVTQGLSMTAVSGVRVRQCVVMGANHSASASQILVEACTDVVVSGCEVSGGPRGIAVLDACADVQIDGCLVHDITEAGIYVSGENQGSVRTAVTGCRIWNITGGTANYPLYFGTRNGYDGKPVDYHLDCRVLGNNVSGIPGKPASGGQGGTSDNIAIYQCRGAVVASNHSLYGGDLGISVDHSDRCIVIGNVCGINDTDGIAVYRSSNCMVTGNLSFNNGRNWNRWYSRNDFSGILVEDNSHDTVVTGNHCWEDGSDNPPSSAGKQQFGLKVSSSSTGTLVADNQLANNASGWVKVPAGQWMGSQYDGTGFRFDAPVRLVGSPQWQNDDPAPPSADLVPTQPGYGTQGYLQLAAAQLGFFAQQPAAQPAVSGSTADAKVDSVIAALVSLGLVTQAAPNEKNEGAAE